MIPAIVSIDKPSVDPFVYIIVVGYHETTVAVTVHSLNFERFVKGISVGVIGNV